MGDRFTTIDTVRKRGGWEDLLCSLRGEPGPHLTQCRRGRDIPPRQVSS